VARTHRRRTRARRVAASAGIAGKILASQTRASNSQSELIGNTWHAVPERSFLAQADLFAFGMACAVIVLAADDAKPRNAQILRSLAGGAAVVIAIVVSLAYGGFGLSTPVQHDHGGRVCPADPVAGGAWPRAQMARAGLPE
jgi:hypothetical protein